MMVTIIIGGIIMSTFLTMFYLEDRDGGGLYDPSSVHPFDDKQ
jgi:hypothetical protein